MVSNRTYDRVQKVILGLHFDTEQHKSSVNELLPNTGQMRRLIIRSPKSRILQFSKWAVARRKTACSRSKQTLTRESADD